MIAVLLVALVAEPPALDDSCDVLELNSVVNDEGRVICRQVIAWEFEQPQGEWHVRDWKLCEGHIARTPRGYEVLLDDKGTLRRIVAPYAKETMRQFDIELREREVR